MLNATALQDQPALEESFPHFCLFRGDYHEPEFEMIVRIFPEEIFAGAVRLYCPAFSFLSIAFLTRAVIVTIMIGYALQLFAHILPAALCRLSVFGYIFNSLHVRELLQV